MKPNESMRALTIEAEAVYGQSDKRMCQIINLLCTRPKCLREVDFVFAKSGSKFPQETHNHLQALYATN